ARGVETFRLAAPGQVQGNLTDTGQCLNRRQLLAKIDETARRQRLAWDCGPRRPDEDKAPGIMVRERAHQHAVDNTEDRRVRADPQRERQERHYGKAGRFLQDSERKTDVGHGFCWVRRGSWTLVGMK